MELIIILVVIIYIAYRLSPRYKLNKIEKHLRNIEKNTRKNDKNNDNNNNNDTINF